MKNFNVVKVVPIVRAEEFVDAIVLVETVFSKDYN
jgi:hypothetical protein